MTEGLLGVLGVPGTPGQLWDRVIAAIIVFKPDVAGCPAVPRVFRAPHRATGKAAEAPRTVDLVAGVAVCPVVPPSNALKFLSKTGGARPSVPVRLGDFGTFAGRHQYRLSGLARLAELSGFFRAFPCVPWSVLLRGTLPYGRVSGCVVSELSMGGVQPPATAGGTGWFGCGLPRPYPLTSSIVTISKTSNPASGPCSISAL